MHNEAGLSSEHLTKTSRLGQNRNLMPVIKKETLMFVAIFNTHALNCVTLSCVFLSVVNLFSIHSNPDTETLLVHRSFGE